MSLYITIHQLDEKLTVDANDEFPLYDAAGAVSKKVKFSNLVPSVSLASLYTKYTKYVVTSPSTIVQGSNQVGYSSINVSILGDVLTITSTADFNNDTFVNPNNRDAIWSQNSSSEIVITFPPGWGTVAIEIYELV